MKVLLIKTSSMGDVIHLLPALTDAGKAFPGIHFDWVVEEAFAEIPRWHPLVNKIIPVAWRRWRRHPFSALHEWQNFYRQLRAEQYDYVIDAQGLLKSALLTRLARGRHCGLDWRSARERFASLAYQQRHRVVFAQHAVVRTRQLLSLALGYTLPLTAPDYGLNSQSFIASSLPDLKPRYLLFIHGASAHTKLWAEANWIALIHQANAAGYPVYLPWGNEEEQQRAARLAAQAEQAYVLPKLSLTQLAGLLLQAQGVVAIDTGLSHLAAALNVPTVALYIATHPHQVGTMGQRQRHLAKTQPSSTLAAPNVNFLPEPIHCDEITAPHVWQELMTLWNK